MNSTDTDIAGLLLHLKKTNNHDEPDLDFSSRSLKKAKVNSIETIPSPVECASQENKGVRNKKSTVVKFLLFNSHLIGQNLLQIERTKTLLYAGWKCSSNRNISIKEAEEIISDSSIKDTVKARENIVKMKESVAKEISQILLILRCDASIIEQDKLSFIRKKILELGKIHRKLYNNFLKLKRDINKFSQPGIADTQAEYDKLLSFQKSIYNDVRSLLEKIQCLK